MCLVEFERLFPFLYYVFVAVLCNVGLHVSHHYSLCPRVDCCLLTVVSLDETHSKCSYVQ